MTSVIICGGGVIGTCVAFYLAERGADVTVVERNGVANGASGLKLLPKLGCRIDPYQCDPPHSVTLSKRPKTPPCAKPGPRQNIDAAPVHFGDKSPIKHALQDGILLV